MPRKRKARTYLRNGRYWIDLRDLRDAIAAEPGRGGRMVQRLQRPLIARGEKLATKDGDTAAQLAADLVRDLQRARRERRRLDLVNADPLDRLGPFAGYHLRKRRESRRPISPEWLGQHRLRLRVVVEHFGADRLLSSIRPEDVEAWLDHLSKYPPGTRSLSDSSLVHYANALGNLYRRAVKEGRVTSNPVYRAEKPSPSTVATGFLEGPDAAMLLECARLFVPSKQGSPPFMYPLIATILLCGLRQEEAEGLAVSDVVAADGGVRERLLVRPHPWRRNRRSDSPSERASRMRLKTRHGQRSVPVPPQLAAILRDYLSGPHAPRPDGLLFPSNRPSRPWSSEPTGLPQGQRMLTRWTLSLAAIVAACQAAGSCLLPKLGCRELRTTWVSHRLQCLDGAARISSFTVREEAGHGSLALIERHYGRLPLVRRPSEHVEFRVEDWADLLAEKLTVLRAQMGVYRPS
jgi:integrase